MKLEFSSLLLSTALICFKVIIVLHLLVRRFEGTPEILAWKGWSGLSIILLLFNLPKTVPNQKASEAWMKKLLRINSKGHWKAAAILNLLEAQPVCHDV